MAGGLLVSAGMVIASFARGVVDMYVTIGIVSGESLPCPLPPTCCAPSPVSQGALAPHTHTHTHTGCA